MECGRRDKGLPPSKPSKFSVYQNQALSDALTANSLQPSSFTFLCIFSLSSASAFALLTVISRENGIIDNFKLQNFPNVTAYYFVKTVQTVIGLVFLGSVFAFFKALSLHRGRFSGGVPASTITKDQTHLTNRQLGFLGIKLKIEQAASDSSRKPPKSKPLSSPSDALVPLHPSIIGSSSQKSSFKSTSIGLSKTASLTSPSKSPNSSSLYLAPGMTSPLPSVQTSPGVEPAVSNPWSGRRVSSVKEIISEEELERFLEEVDERMTESAGKLATPPPAVSGFGIATPTTVVSSANTSGTARSTPLRPVRMSPSSQKFTTPPKKRETDLPPPLSMEESIETFKHLGIYPEIDQWRDHLRQWFSSVLLNPLLTKIDISHIQVMQGASKLGISITVSPVGSDTPASETPSTLSSMDRTKQWQTASTLDEEGLLHHLRATIVQSIDASTPKLTLPIVQQSPQQNPVIPVMQDFVDAITEHQKLLGLMKGEWVKGLLQQSSIQADYTVQRIRELAEGTCVKNYEYLSSGEDYEKRKKKWVLELPTDSHLLLYLFCAFLEHPKWLLHVDPASYAGAHSSKNPLFLGFLPPKECFPEKYVAVLSGVPSVLHPGACILAVGKQSPPIFSLYWDKKLQFSLQGRTALWDSVLILCHKIKVSYGGIIRGMHLGSSALSILPVLDSSSED